MAATQLINTLVEYDYPNGPGSTPNTKRVDGAYGNKWTIAAPRLITLSDNIGLSNDIEGFLYVPNSSPGCSNTTAQYIPNNVTRINDIPSTNQFPVIAFGPWLPKNLNCTLDFLNDARKQQARALYTYIPGGDFQSGPPNASDSAWDLGDGGAWRQRYQFPVYGIGSGDAAALVTMLARYSGSIDSGPDGPQLSTMYPAAGAKVRIYSQADGGNGATLPSLWVFLLIVLGILLAVLLIASLAMRIIQRRRRRELQRMIANGDVNLEALGVARIKVTEDVLGKMPLYFYVEHGGTPAAAHAPRAEDSDAAAAAPANKRSVLPGFMHRKKKLDTAAEPSNTLPATLEEKAVMFPQDSCPICLDDYENHVTPVRWLPCSHVFHPACIDPLMREYSSLCPICKASVLPKDYIPEVTNVMVRRQRLNQRFRDIEQRERERAANQPNMPVHFSGIGRFVRVSNSHNTAPPNSYQTQASNSHTQDVEMQSMQPAESSGTVTQRTASGVLGDPSARRPENVSREEWARQRAAALVGTSETVQEAEQREEARKPLWRRALGPIFPNLR